MSDADKPGPRSEAGRGVTWGGDEPEKTPPPDPRGDAGVYSAVDDEALRQSADPSTGEVLAAMWTGLLRFWIQRIWRPVVTLRDKAAAKFLDRTVDSDTFDRERANQWKKFHDGRTSSSYLQDTDDQ